VPRIDDNGRECPRGVFDANARARATGEEKTGRDSQEKGEKTGHGHSYRKGHDLPEIFPETNAARAKTACFFHAPN
jgi:hypothetical protein